MSSEFNREGSIPTSPKKTFAKSPSLRDLKAENLNPKHKQVFNLYMKAPYKLKGSQQIGEYDLEPLV